MHGSSVFEDEPTDWHHGQLFPAQVVVRASLVHRYAALPWRKQRPFMNQTYWVRRVETRHHTICFMRLGSRRRVRLLFEHLHDSLQILRRVVRDFDFPFAV